MRRGTSSLASGKYIAAFPGGRSANATTTVIFPVGLFAYFQWGLSTETAYILLAYAVIQILDGNLLAPLLLSEVVNLHPVAIVIAVLIFGGMWGVWGLFFAIPLATLVHAVIKAWGDQLKRTDEAERPAA